jgi:hypothetical protein
VTVTAARTAAEQLRVALLDNGVRRVSIELQPGVGPKSDAWGVAPFVRGMGHHIASYPSQGDTPGLGVVKGGRKGVSPLQGPLANCYGGFDLTARIITMGWANHPGEGGPWTAPGWGTVPRDNGRPYVLGWEFEGGYLEYTDEMHDFMARCGAGTLDWLGWLNGREPAPLECWGEHKDPWAPGRKVDRIGYTAASGRARIATVRGANSQEDNDMTPEQSKMLTDVYNRVMGRDVQRWMKQNPDGSPVITGPDDPEGWPARSVDIADILTLTGVVSGGDAAVLAHVDAGSAADADRDARLAAQLGALGTDPAAIVEALRAGLGDDFAKQVVAELGKQLAS